MIDNPWVGGLATASINSAPRGIASISSRPTAVSSIVEAVPDVRVAVLGEPFRVRGSDVARERGHARRSPFRSPRE